MFVNDFKLIVRYAETDQMGIVHHSNYAVWFEASRTDFIKQLGITYSKIEEMGFMLPLIELKCNFLGADKYEDEITVRTTIKDLTFTRVTFYYEVYKKGSDKPITTGETIHAWTDRSLKPVNLKKKSPDLYGILAKAL